MRECRVVSVTSDSDDGNGPVWELTVVRPDPGIVGLPDPDPADVPLDVREAVRAWIVRADPPELPQDGFSEPDAPDEDFQCSASSWRGTKGRHGDNQYGPGGFNRCILAADHAATGLSTLTWRHEDDWGHVFTVKPDGSDFHILKVVRTLTGERE